MGKFHLVIFFLTVINDFDVLSSTIEISKTKDCKDSNSSQPCPSETLLVETDSSHGFLISVVPYTIKVNATEGVGAAVPKPYKLVEDIVEVLNPEEKLFLIQTVGSLDEDLADNETSTDASAMTAEDILLGMEKNKLPVSECTTNCPDSCERNYKDGNLTLFTSSCGMNYNNSLEFCLENEGEIFIPRQEGDNDIMFALGADFYSKNNEYQYFWYPMKRPTYGEKAVWANGAEFEAYETPFIGDSNSNQYRCFVFKHDGESLMTYDQFCRVTNSRPICQLF